MSFLVVNAITDARSDAETAEAFDSMVQSLAKAVRLGIENFKPKGDIRHVYVQFQFDCGALPNAVHDRRVARYSKKYAHIEAYAEVTLGAFRAVAMRGRCEFLVRRLGDALEAVVRALDGKVQNNVQELLPTVLDLGRTWCDSEVGRQAPVQGASTSPD